MMKQIEEQKVNQSFSANPFEDQEMNDKEGDELMKKFQGEAVGNKTVKEQKDLKTDKRSKYSFLLGVNMP